MKTLIKNMKTLTKIGERGIVMFLGKEAKFLKWNEKTKLNVIVFDDKGKKGIFIEKV